MLIARFPLNYDINNVVNDKYRIASSATQYNTGFLSEYALVLNGGQFYIDNPFIDLNRWTLAFWVYDVGSNDWADIFTFSNSYERIEIHNSGASWTWYANNTTNSNVINSGTSITTGLARSVWRNVILTFDNGTSKLYVDGSLKITQTGKRTFSSSCDKLFFGSRIGGAYANIRLQDLRCYNHVLSDRERNNLLRIPVLHYDFENMYDPIEFIEGTGSQGIVLNVTPTSKYTIEAEFAMTRTDVTSCIWCARGSTTSSNSTTAFYIANSGVRCDYGTSATMTNIGAVPTNVKHILTMSANNWYLDGESKTSMTEQTFTAGGKIRLFSSYTNGENNGIGNYSYLRLYRFKIYDENKNLIFDGIPMMNRYNGNVGLYDKVNSNFHTSSVDLVAYKEIDYIYSTGTQWIDSGVSIAANTRIEAGIKFNSAFDYNMMYGAWSLFSLSLKGDNTWCVASGGTSTQNLGPGSSTSYIYLINHTPSSVSLNESTTNFGSGSNTVSDRHILLFAASNSGNTPYSWSSFGKGRIYYFRIYNGNVMVRNFVPVIRTNDCVAGLFDKVNNVFYGNQGSGYFRPSVEIINGFALSVKYIMPVEYIKSDGNGYCTLNTSYSGYFYEHDIQFINNGSRQLMGGNGNTGTYWGINSSGYYEMEGATSISGYDRHKVTYYAGSRLYVDGTLVKTCSLSPADANYTVFALNGGSYKCAAKIYSLKVYDSAGYVRSYYIPVKRTTASTYGLFDVMTGSYAECSKSSGFSYGHYAPNLLQDENRNNNQVYFGMDRIAASKGPTVCVGNDFINNDVGLGTTSLTTLTSNGYQNNQGFVSLPNLYLKNSFTVCGWVKFLQHTTWARIFDFGTATSGTDYAIGLATSDTSGTLVFFGRTGSGASFPDTVVGTVGLNTWYHFATVIDNTTAKFYLNGSLVSTFTINASIGERWYNNNLIAKSNWSSDGYSAKVFSDFRVYNTALSAEDIADIYGSRAVVDKTFDYYTDGNLNGAVGVSKQGVTKAIDYTEGGNNLIISGNYTRLSHVTATGTQFINSGITSLTNPYAVTIKYMKVNTETSDQCLFGQRQFGKFTNIYNNYYESAFGNSPSNSASGENVIHTVFMDSAKGLFKDDAQLLGGSLGNASSSYPALICAFSESDPSGAKWFFKGNIYDIKITNNGELYRHYIPVKRNSDNAIGLLDAVEGVFYTSNGSNQFIAGVELGPLASFSCKNFYADGGVNIANTKTY